MEMMRRLKIYFEEMMPLQQTSSGIILAISFFMALARSNNVQLSVTTPMITAAVSLCLFMILIRIMDEYKDYEDDLINYPERPLPSGRVLFKDLKVLSFFVVTAILALNTYNSSIFAAACVVFGFSVLMLKWFFMEAKIRSSLPLALITHHPIVYLYFIYLFVAFRVSYPSAEFSSLYLMIPFATGFTNWEISRKIRAPKDEDSYTTYSQILGLNGAIGLAVALQLIVMVSTTYYFIKVSAPLWFIGLFIAMYLPIMKLYLFFPTKGTTIKNASPKRPLRPIAEAFQIVLIFSVILEYFLF